MPSKPQNSDEVFDVMDKYAKSKGYVIPESTLRLEAEKCYLTHESKKWNNCKYWPPLAMRWILTNCKGVSKAPKPRKGKSVREQILESHDSF